MEVEPVKAVLAVMLPMGVARDRAEKMQRQLIPGSKGDPVARVG